jgi:glycosyltransferase involved in cell wall biosynthesis
LNAIRVSGDPGHPPRRVTYLLDLFPRVTETFVYNEVRRALDADLLEGVWTFARDDAGLDRLGDELRRRTRTLASDYVPRRRRPALTARALRRLAPGRLAGAWYDARRHGQRQPFWRAVALATAHAGERRRLHVHFAAGEACLLAHYLARLTGWPLTITAHRYDIFDSPPVNLVTIARHAERIVTISDYNRRWLVNELGLPPAKIEVIRCGIELDAWPFLPVRERAPDAPLRLLNVARLVPQKGQEDLLDAARLLGERGLPFELRIIGEGDRRPMLEARRRELGLERQVRFCGVQPSGAIRAALAESDVFVLSSHSEGIPVSMMEAMASGTPVLATDVQGVCELARPGRTALVVPPGEPEALAAAICTLAAAPTRARALARAARSAVERDHDAARQFRSLTELWARGDR